MAKGKAEAKPKGKRRGCTSLLALVAAIALCAFWGMGRDTTTRQRTTAPTPNAATRDAVIGTAKVIAQTATLTPSATITDTPQVAQIERVAATTAPGVQVTAISSILYYVRSNANARTCPDTECESLGLFQAGEYIGVDGVASGTGINGNRRWYRTQYLGQTVYIHDSLVIEGALVAAPQSQAPQVRSDAPAQQPAAPGFTCPSNCDGARAMGLSAEQAATCPGLDRDNDGVACYGN